MTTAAGQGRPLSSSSTPQESKGAVWTGRVLSILVVLFLLFDAYGKFAKPVQVTDAMAKLGMPISLSVIIGVLLLICTVLYAIPQTAVLGAVVLTGYLGGAVAIQLRAGMPTFETFFPVLFAGLGWLGIYLRKPKLRRSTGVLSGDDTIMTSDLEHTMALLERTPGALDELLRGLPTEWTDVNEGGDSWSSREIVAHLSHGERTDWIPRVKHLLGFGERQPFPPFDREGQRTAMEGMSMAELLDEFAGLRAASLDELRGLAPSVADMERRGMHPVLGSVTLGQLLATWAAHDLTHLHQISRVMAHQYREAVGPWSKFLGVMHCEGHSE